MSAARSGRLVAASLAAVLLATMPAVSGTPAASAATQAADVLPSLDANLIDYYDFEHPVPGNPAQEADHGLSGTPINLVNGGAQMRVADGAYPASRYSLQTMQVNPAINGNDDWKAGIYSASGVPSLHAFNHLQQATIMVWVKTTGTNPNLNSTTANPTDYYNAFGIAGVLSGNSDGHNVRFLIEVEAVSGALHLVALGRRIDTGSSQVFAANQDWHTLLPLNHWVFLAATFDFNSGKMALYRNGAPVSGFYATPGDPWGLNASPGPHYTSATDPAGIKIGGSFPQNTLERNPCNCRFDSIMFLNRAVRSGEVNAQYQRALNAP